MLYQKQRFLYSWLPKHAIMNHIRHQCLDEEVKRLDSILAQWETANQKFAQLAEQEASVPNTVEIRGIDSKFTKRIEQLKEEPTFKRTFEAVSIDFKVVEIDKLIACQNVVILDYVEKLLEKYPKKPTEEDLINICLPLTKELPAVSDLKVSDLPGPVTYLYSSENTDFRFLGAVPKQLEESDFKNVSVGVPVKGLLVMLGYGIPIVNVLSVGKKLILNNGFHRLYALRSLGVTHAPVVIQKIKNPALEFQGHLGIPKEWILSNDTRPALMKDYFDLELIIELKAKARRRGIKVTIISEPFDVPL